MIEGVLHVAVLPVYTRYAYTRKKQVTPDKLFQAIALPTT